MKQETLSSGFKTLDKLLGGGLHKKELTILGARPAQGKTSLSLQIASRVALRAHEAVLLFSSELSRHAVMGRMIAYEAHLNPADARSGLFNGEQWRALTEAAVRLSEAPLHIIDVPEPSTPTVRSITGQLISDLRHKRRSLGLVIIDQLHLLNGPSNAKVPARRGEVAGILKDLRGLASEFNVAMLLLSQLPGRPKRHSRNFTPTNTDLERAGVTDYFDRAILLYRERAYRPDPALDMRAKLFVARGPAGPLRECEIQFDPATSIFSDGKVRRQGHADSSPQG